MSTAIYLVPRFGLNEDNEPRAGLAIVAETSLPKGAPVPVAYAVQVAPETLAAYPSLADAAAAASTGDYTVRDVATTVNEAREKGWPVFLLTPAAYEIPEEAPEEVRELLSALADAGREVVRKTAEKYDLPVLTVDQVEGRAQA